MLLHSRGNSLSEGGSEVHRCLFKHEDLSAERAEAPQWADVFSNQTAVESLILQHRGRSGICLLEAYVVSREEPGQG